MVVVVLPPVVPRIRLGETAAEGRLRLRSICGIARRRELLPRILRELLRIGRPAGTGCGLRSGGHCAAGCFVGAFARWLFEVAALWLNRPVSIHTW
jgi:hypothetical protein